MGEQDERPIARAVFKALREQSRRLDQEVRFYDVGLVRRISDQVAPRTNRRPMKPDVTSVLEALRARVERQTPSVRFHEVGTVQHIGDGVATLSGLPRAATDELVTFPTGVQGLILNLERERIDVILLGPEEGIQGGDLVTASNQRLRVPVGHNLLGRIVNPLGEPLDERGPVTPSDFRHLERDAPGIIERAPVDEPLHTGLKIIDALIPVGRGQRELIIGDRRTGKTSLAVDTILNQREADVACVYVAIGQKKSSALAVIDALRKGGALPYTIVVVSGPDDPPALRYLAPYAGCTMAEFLMYEGRDVLIVYDDLTRHADAYRELSLLLRRPPGREAYPGDIFYLHARLLERACKLNDAQGGGSLTALPIVEMQRGNIASYIPTNLISINDGQIVLDTSLFNRGIKPAVDVGRSVSRVGGAAQSAAMRAVASKLRLEMSQFEEVVHFTRFGTEVDEATQRQIRRGERLRAALTQPVHRPQPLAFQLLILQAATEGYLDDIPRVEVPAFERGLFARFEAEHPGICQHINQGGELDEEMQAALTATLANYHEAYLKGAVASTPVGEDKL